MVTNQKLKVESTLDKRYGSPQSLPAAEVDKGKWSDQSICLKQKSTEN